MNFNVYLVPLLYIKSMYQMKYSQKLFAIIIITLLSLPVQAQKAGLESITAGELKMHMKFLASDELQGRNTGEPGMQIAARYLAVQAEELGLRAMDRDQDFMQPYIIEEKAYDRENSHITITGPDSSSQISTENFYMLTGQDGDHTILEGEVVFAGYGLKTPDHAGVDYNSYSNLEVKDKAVIVLNDVPPHLSDAEKKEVIRYATPRYKALMARQLGAAAIIFVSERSGSFSGIGKESIPGHSGMLALWCEFFIFPL